MISKPREDHQGLFGHESVTVVHVPTFDFNIGTQYSRMSFAVRNKEDDSIAFEMAFSSIFGVRFINHLANESDSQPEDVYLDLDLDLQRMTDKIFVVLYDGKIYITSGGLSFVDIIYAGNFNSLTPEKDHFDIKFDNEYILPYATQFKYTYEVLPVDTIPESLKNQLNVVRDSLHAD